MNINKLKMMSLTREKRNFHFFHAGPRPLCLSLTQILLGIMFTFTFLYGCAGTPGKPETGFVPIQNIDAPGWVVKGSGAFNTEKNKVFYGVGISDYKDIVIQRNSADNQARKEVAKVIDVYVASLEKEYRASTAAGSENSESSEKHTEEAMKTVTAMTIHGVEIIDHWQHPATGNLYSLARLDLAAFKDGVENLKEMNELDRKLKEYVRQNAERLHEQLEKEEDKLKDK